MKGFYECVAGIGEETTKLAFHYAATRARMQPLSHSPPRRRTDADGRRDVGIARGGTPLMKNRPPKHSFLLFVVVLYTQSRAASLPMLLPVPISPIHSIRRREAYQHVCPRPHTSYHSWNPSGYFRLFLTRENTKNVNHADPDPDIPIHEIGPTIVRPLSIKFNSIIDNETNGLTFSISAAKSKII